MQVGTIIRAKKDSEKFGLKEGDRGYIYEAYMLGYSAIFQDGHCEGFTRKEARELLERIRMADYGYEFKGLEKLQQDFQAGRIPDLQLPRPFEYPNC